MTIKRKLLLKFILIIVLFVFSGLIAYPEVARKAPPVFAFFDRFKIKLGLDLQGGIHLEYRADLSQVEQSQQKEAMQAVQDVIERRVNAFGVSEPAIYTTKIGGENRVVVELAGIKDINEAKKMIKETPFLEFKELKAAEGETGKGGDLGFVKKGAFVPEFDKVLFEENLKDGEIKPELVETQFGWHIIKKIEQRGEGETLEVHAAHILFQKQSEEDPNQEGAIPADIIKDTNEQSKLKGEEVLKKALAGEDFFALANEYSQDPGNQPQPQFVSTGLTGKNLKSAIVDFQNQGLSEPTVALKFDDEGTQLFAEITKRNLQKQVAIYLDEEIISAPTVQAEITNGQAVINGNFTLETAQALVKRLNEGALPVPISLVGQQSVEATLGEASLKQILEAGAIGLLAVVVFMVFYYRFLGLVASLALLIYTAMMVTIFKLTGITLTLSGIAGFILSIGMAVDANILVFERTKEEIRKGKTIANSLEEGFKRAWTSIRDGNISSLLTAGILYMMGTGFVKGFAAALFIGVVVSMFTAVVISRTMLRFIISDWIHGRSWMVGVKKSDIAS